MSPLRRQVWASIRPKSRIDARLGPPFSQRGGHEDTGGHIKKRHVLAPVGPSIFLQFRVDRSARGADDTDAHIAGPDRSEVTEADPQHCQRPDLDGEEGDAKNDAHVVCLLYREIHRAAVARTRVHIDRGGDQVRVAQRRLDAVCLCASIQGVRRVNVACMLIDADSPAASAAALTMRCTCDASR